MTAYLFPGQGSQKEGMGDTLFDEFSELTQTADKILGYSIKELCLQDPNKNLANTAYTQPALFVVNALMYQKKLQDGQKPSFVAGHSLGEYSALYAAGCFDFETGLKLVQRRGKLMSEISGGGMAAILGKTKEEVADILKQNGLEAIDVANLNSYKQVVISGKKDDVIRSKDAFEQAGARFFPLNVSGAFHSRYMKPAKEEYARNLAEFSFKDPQIPCIANYTAEPYQSGEVQKNLAEQLDHSVRWVETIEYLTRQGVVNFEEIGPGMVLKGLIAKIQKGS